jgi:hypothetical protein
VAEGASADGPRELALRRAHACRSRLKLGTSVLEDQPKAWRVLMMFDGPENGAPTEYVIE